MPQVRPTDMISSIRFPIIEMTYKCLLEQCFLGPNLTLLCRKVVRIFVDDFKSLPRLLDSLIEFLLDLRVDCAHVNILNKKAQ